MGFQYMGQDLGSGYIAAPGVSNWNFKPDPMYSGRRKQLQELAEGGHDMPAWRRRIAERQEQRKKYQAERQATRDHNRSKEGRMDRLARIRSEREYRKWERDFDQRFELEERIRERKEQKRRDWTGRIRSGADPATTNMGAMHRETGGYGPSFTMGQMPAPQRSKTGTSAGPSGDPLTVLSEETESAATSRAVRDSAEARFESKMKVIRDGAQATGARIQDDLSTFQQDLMDTAPPSFQDHLDYARKAFRRRHPRIAASADTFGKMTQAAGHALKWGGPLG